MTKSEAKRLEARIAKQWLTAHKGYENAKGRNDEFGMDIYSIEMSNLEKRSYMLAVHMSETND